MNYLESLSYLEENLDNLVEANGRFSKMPKLDGKCYITPSDMDLVVKALTTASKKPIQKNRVKNIALNVRTAIDKDFSPFL